VLGCAQPLASIGLHDAFPTVRKVLEPLDGLPCADLGKGPCTFTRQRVSLVVLEIGEFPSRCVEERFDCPGVPQAFQCERYVFMPGVPRRPEQPDERVDAEHRDALEVMRQNHGALDLIGHIREQRIGEQTCSEALSIRQILSETRRKYLGRQATRGELEDEGALVRSQSSVSIPVAIGIVRDRATARATVLSRVWRVQTTADKPRTCRDPLT